jgi:hypothetical protein
MNDGRVHPPRHLRSETNAGKAQLRKIGAELSTDQKTNKQGQEHAGLLLILQPKTAIWKPAWQKKIMEGKKDDARSRKQWTQMRR